jgi:hypothetical protein
MINDEGAYWLGFLFADGYVRRQFLYVRLTAADRGHLVKFRKFLGSAHPIVDDPARTAAGYLCRPSCRIQVFSVRLGQRVLDLGRYEGQVPMTLTSSRHFWRGVVDGDGSVGFTSKGFPSLQLVGTRRLMDAFLQFLREEGLAARMTVRPSKSIYTVSTAGHTAAAIVHLLYANGPVALNRKAAAAELVMAQERRDEDRRRQALAEYTERRRTARIFYLAGQSLEQVGVQMGVSNVTVLRWLRETHTPRRPRSGGRRAATERTADDPREARYWPVAGGIAG